jgi:hypothetical protein
MFAMATARLACGSDLAPLLALFGASEVRAAARPIEQAERIWRETLAHPGVFVLVSEEGSRAERIRECIDSTSDWDSSRDFEPRMSPIGQRFRIRARLASKAEVPR